MKMSNNKARALLALCFLLAVASAGLTLKAEAWNAEKPEPEQKVEVKTEVVLNAGLAKVTELVTEAVEKAEQAEPVVTPEPDPAPTYTEEELEILAIIIYQEAGGDSFVNSTRQMVGEVFLNRVASDRYPDTFLEVATQRAQYGRLHWTGIKWPDRAQYAVEAHAVARAYECARALLEGSVARMLPEDTIYQAEFAQGSQVVAYQDNTYFCR